MPAGRRNARRQAVFILYQQDLLKLGVEAALSRTEGTEIDEYASRIVIGAGLERALIDALIGEHLSVWSLDRLGVLERAILRVAVYELTKESGVPVAVVIDEAVSLAKRFCSSEAGSLVNGVLGGVAGATRPDRPEAGCRAEGLS
jgi:N utilization substance protein B